MDNSDYPCDGCLFVIVCDTICEYARTFDLTLGRILETGKCSLCGELINYREGDKPFGTIISCTGCKFIYPPQEKRKKHKYD